MRLNIHRTSFLIFWFSSSHVKIDVCTGDDLQTFYPSEADSRRIERVGRSKLIHSNLTEPDVKLMNYENFDV